MLRVYYQSTKSVIRGNRIALKEKQTRQEQFQLLDSTRILNKQQIPIYIAIVFVILMMVMIPGSIELILQHTSLSMVRQHDM
jgi:hypothetical protein